MRRVGVCGLALAIVGAPAAAWGQDDDPVVRQFVRGSGGDCGPDELDDPIFEVHAVPGQALRLYQFLCVMGASNLALKYYIAHDDGRIEVASFEVPTFDVVHGSPSATSIEGVRLTTERTLFEGRFDPATLEIRASAVRTPDEWETGVWTLSGGAFQLSDYAYHQDRDDELVFRIVEGGALIATPAAERP